MSSHDAALAAEVIDTRTLRFDRVADDTATRDVPIEAPIAFEYDGIGYAVMMATPSDLEDFAVGFTLSERLAKSVAEIASVDVAELPRSWVVRIALNGASDNGLRERVRLRLTEGSCGLCGLETIEQVLRPLPRLERGPRVDRAAIARALAVLDERQPLGRATGAAHAAAFCAPDGTLLEVREDVGRHNAMDKLIGASAQAGLDLSTGFILLTARCSYELVEKAVTAGCPALVTISAPTSLAVERAKESGLTLVSLARRDSMLVVNNPHGSFA
jgi:FdhD protein